ncbi:restriction endonuclease subunit S [Helicobacter sp. 12S02634-8]|uniref:restriction endonuclease subunit S n=1 Tax=Helicobacter sp. 12S02634-8 TaxID=1476199 RepID=UPI00209BD6FE|nr:restriction endonuclease subunit S [Helicobacter sp. 12S02634-8]
MSLGEIGNFYGGLSGKSKNDFKDGNARFIPYNNVYAHLSIDFNETESVKIEADENQRALEYGDVVFTGSSETPNECGISSVVTQRPCEKIYLNSFCFILRFHKPIVTLPEFTKYLFRSHHLRKEICKTAQGVTRFNVSKNKMAKIKIPIPPLEVQEEIVEILDKFHTLTHSLTQGIPQEITLRQKQYAYYRDTLLDFKELAP